MSIEAIGNDCNKEIAACGQLLARQQETLYAAKQRAYQQWAISKIQTFDVNFEKALTGIANPHWGTSTDYEWIKNEMANDLLPLSEGLLDRPVAEMYQRSFKRGWDKLDGREDQTEVAKQCAVIVKKNLTDMEKNCGCSSKNQAA